MLGPWPVHTPAFNPGTTTWGPTWSQWLSRLVEEVNIDAPVAFADLPLTPTVGQLAVVNNSNTVVWGAVIAGGGANTVLGWWNGVAWTVVGI